MSKKVLDAARKAKDDEFYTQITDIEKEVFHYKDQLKGKTILCNCDDPASSHFVQYFALNFNFFGLKKLISTHFDKDKPTYKLELTGKMNSKGDVKLKDIIETPLKQNGDFRSPECIELLKEADIVITNPPFSLFREYLAQLIEYDKKFLIVGNINSLARREVFNLIKDNKIWLGYNEIKEFRSPEKIMKKFGNICWYTNLFTAKRKEDLVLFKKYTPKEFPFYINYEAIEVSKVAYIPLDWEGEMGVPVSFLDKYNPEQFEIIGLYKDLAKPLSSFIKDSKIKGRDLFIMLDNKLLCVYSRIIIRNRKPVKGT